MKHFADISVPIYTDPASEYLTVVKPAQNIPHHVYDMHILVQLNNRNINQ